ncbi:MAG: DUF3604 domain-containing protein [Promethearchaeota archaeon]
MKQNKYRIGNLNVKSEVVEVRNLVNLSFNFSIEFDLPKDSSLIFRLRGGRNNKNDWYYLQPYDHNLNGYVTLNLDPPVKTNPILITGKDLLIKYLVCDKRGIKKDTNLKLNIYNTLVQSLVEQYKKIEILIEFPNKSPILIENSPTINVMNKKNFDHITIISPSLVAVNEEFKILIRIEDQFKNLVKNFNSKVQLFEILTPKKRNLLNEVKFNEKDKGLFIISGLKFSKSGIFYFEVASNHQSFKSNPIICREKPLEKRLYWGYIHGHSLKSDGIRELEEYFDNMINAGLDFGTVTEHDHLWETSNEDFEDIKKKVKKYHKDYEFVSLFGYEWGTWYSGYGDICIYHNDDSIPIFRSELNKYNSTRKLIKNLKPYKEKVLMIAHHTALRPGYRDWTYFDNSLEKLVEIYSTWGNQEYPSIKGNPLPPRYKFFGYGKYARKRGAVLEKRDSFVSDALKRGYKLGFVAGGDDHFGIYPSGSIDPDNGIYPSGIMAVWAEKLTKESIWKALHNRKCYGTTGARVIIEFFINNHFMGDIIDIEKDLYLISERKIRGSVYSDIPIIKIELIRNNSIIDFKVINHEKATYEFVDSNLFYDIALKHTQKNELFIFYYMRVFLSNNMAWSSPIWLIKNL